MCVCGPAASHRDLSHRASYTFSPAVGIFNPGHSRVSPSCLFQVRPETSRQRGDVAANTELTPSPPNPAHFGPCFPAEPGLSGPEPGLGG